MVCQRCVSAVADELKKLGLEAVAVSLGGVTLKKTPTPDQVRLLDTNLAALGFKRIDDKRVRLIEGIKNKIIHAIHHSPELDKKYNWSTVLAEEMQYEYNYLSNLFSSVEGITIEQYIIRQKIEKVKELVLYDELSLREIASRLNYSSAAHLSAQFKKITGMSPTDLKKVKKTDGFRKSLDAV